MSINEHLRYPVGRFAPAAEYSLVDRDIMLTQFRNLPNRYAQLCQQIETQEKWQLSYRPGGWTAQQVAHHLADSHLNAYQRFKHTLTEENPTLRGYDEQAWALLADNQLSYFVSHQLLSSIHERIYHTLAGLNEEQWQRACVHPSQPDVGDLTTLLAVYDWHGRHHLGHLTIILNA